MKRKILPLVISGIAVMGAQAALAADATVYGKLNVSLQKVDEEINGDDTTDNFQLLSNASRLGVKGSTDINGSLKAIYQLEYETFVDDGDKSGETFTQRNTFVGVQGDWGTVKAGKFDTPLKEAQGKVDLFNDLTSGDIKNLMEGEVRADNIVSYTSKLYNEIQYVVAIIPGEEGGSDADRDGFADGISASVKYEKDGLYFAVAIDQDVVGGYDVEQDVIRLVASYSMDNWVLGGIINTVSANDADVDGDLYDLDEEALLVSVAYNIDKWTLKGQIGRNTVDFETDALGGFKGEDDVTQILFGADYSLSKNTKAFGYYGSVEHDVEGVDVEESTFGVGIEHKF